MKQTKKANMSWLRRLFVCALLAALLCTWTACGGQEESETAGPDEDYTAIGDRGAAHWFYFEVTDTDGQVTKMKVHTDQTVVGAALLEQDLIAGKEDTYGLYVLTVLGQTVVYEEDGKYWAFYEGGTYAAKGVDSTTIQDGALYAFKVE